MSGYSTREAIALINAANPASDPLNDDHVRAAVRRDKVPAPATRFAGRYLWSGDEVAALASVLKRQPPEAIRSEVRDAEMSARRSFWTGGGR